MSTGTCSALCSGHVKVPVQQVRCVSVFLTYGISNLGCVHWDVIPSKEVEEHPYSAVSWPDSQCAGVSQEGALQGSKDTWVIWVGGWGGTCWHWLKVSIPWPRKLCHQPVPPSLHQRHPRTGEVPLESGEAGLLGEAACAVPIPPAAGLACAGVV